MKNVLLLSVLALACCNANAQTSSSTSDSAAQAGAQAGATAVGGGAATSASQGGAGGSGGTGTASSNVTVNLGSTDPSSAGQTSNAQQAGSGTTTQIKESIKTVGNPGAASYGVSFSQYNCANTAAAGVGWLGGVFQLGGGVESGPCNDRANASALFQIAGALQTSNGALSSQLYHAAILLIGNSTRETREALAQAGVADWQPQAAPAAIAPAAGSTGEAVTTPVPDPEVIVHH
ncbi:hypothetical protein [Paraburkholderia silvatlantica]|uniref:hypothetical protein n=1 Tax=Paraburkholderia silvatlantica TaxID=321895 RepID=UPI003750FFF9